MSHWTTLYGWFWPVLTLVMLALLLALGGAVIWVSIRDNRAVYRKRPKTS